MLPAGFVPTWAVPPPWEPRGCLETRPLILVAERGPGSPTLRLYFWQGSSLNSAFPSLSEPPVLCVIRLMEKGRGGEKGEEMEGLENGIGGTGGSPPGCDSVTPQGTAGQMCSTLGTLPTQNWGPYRGCGVGGHNQTWVGVEAASSEDQRLKAITGA